MRKTDEVIYRRFLADHHEDDLRILLERHREGLVLFLYGYVHSMEDAEDLMLDAFAEAAAGARFSGKSTFKTWLFAIGKKLALRHLRRRRLASGYQTLPDETVQPPELDILKEERSRQLFLALSRLREEYRQILLLLYFEEMSHEEAALVMGKTRKQLYNLAERGRKALKDQLERMGFDHAEY
ncbi:MAG: RNA polymerase sigma factor [Oscillospiraceae bacterium]|nr:RNA polymerase sigma factor [Oscillospiraceae bacterium]